MLLSIIIVSYNEAEYLSECFESILNQNIDFDYEVIVGDDGSSDNSLEVIKKYEKKFKHFSYFVQEREPGLKKENVIASIRASNVVFRALKMAKGKYMNLVSGDDYFIDMDYFKRAVNFLESNKSYSAYLTTFYSVYPDGTKERNDLRTDERFSFWYQQYIHCSCFVFRKIPQNALLKLFSDDCGLQYSIALNGKLKYTNEYTFAYRQREKSIMHSHDREGLDIVEMLLFQDILNKKLPSLKSLYSFLKLYILSFRHFRGPFLNLYEKKGQLDGQKYKKYTDFSQNYKNDVIHALIFPDEAKSKRLLKKVNKWIRISDRVLKNIYYKKTKKCKVPVSANVPKPLPISVVIQNFKLKKEKIFYAIDLFKNKRKKTVIQGWAFVPNTSCEIFLYANKKYHQTSIYSRADVKEAYGYTSINEGFFEVIDDVFEDFELCLVDRKNQCVYREQICGILEKYILSEEVHDIGVPIEKDFPFTIDEKKYRHGKTYLRGWAYHDNDDCEIFIEANGKTYTAHLVRRPDVMRVFELENDKLGFTAELPFKVASFSLLLVNHTKNEIYKTFIRG